MDISFWLKVVLSSISEYTIPASPRPSPVNPLNKDSFNMGCDAPVDTRWDVTASEGDAPLLSFLSHFLLGLTLKFYHR